MDTWNGMKYQPKQLVKLCTGYANPVVMRVKSIWKNGNVVIETLTGHQYDTRFNSSGSRTGRNYSNHICYITPLKDGETPESIDAESQAADAEKAAERAAKRNADVAAISHWWMNTGKAWWDSRLVVEGGLGGKEVAIVRIQGEDSLERVTLVAYKQVEKLFDGGMEYELESSGMSARTFNGQTNVNAYSTSTIRATTLDEALYWLTR